MRRIRRTKGTLQQLASHNSATMYGGALHGTPLGDYLARVSNWFFLTVALIMWAIAWPTLQLTFHVSPELMPVFSGAAVLPLALLGANTRLAWGVIAITALVFPVFYSPFGRYEFDWQVCLVISLLVSTVFMYLRQPLPEAIGAWAVGSILFAAHAPGGGGWIAGLTVLLVVCLLIRLILRSRQMLASQTEENELERARRTVLEERTRIARDLHDIVAHRMSLVVVQAQTAQYRVPALSDPAKAEFEGIAVAAREALNEVRSLLGVLRLEGQAVQHAPLPTLASIDDMIEGTRAAGIQVDYLPAPNVESVSDATALAAYRIVQESIANASRHAQGASITVALIVDGPVLNILVENGPRITDRDHGGVGLGHGITGMMERAQSIGGSLAAAPRPDGGFAVRAILPLTTVPISV
ncbi:sensor histidine kinase [Smaragdicoccus niigatensis]|uniref:sensor histidine kinase n=1 Tax=Smaragdicoccus niigatensis TaxID=359359 RepID=UPI00039D6F85|nr:histidine kinase [Smaragdicoccus niigatensis]